MRICIAEDNEAYRYFLERTLARAGYEVIGVGNGRELVDRFRETMPDLVITDVKMPLMSGFEAIAEIRKDGKAAHVPVIFVSAAYRDIAAKLKGLEVGGNDYLPAPIDPDELLFRVQANLGIKALFDGLLESRAANERLLGENRRLMQRLFAVQESERRRTARELHDELGQWLTAMQAQAQLIVRVAGDEAPDIVAAADRILAIADILFQKVRGMIRDLRPLAFDILDLEANLVELVANWETDQAGTACRMQIHTGLGDLDEARSVTLYRVVQEALTNIARHAGAERVEIDIRRSHTAAPGSPYAPPTCTPGLRVTIADDGRGMVPGGGGEGTGLLGMRERVLAAGGTFALESSPGRGVRIDVWLPVAPGGVASETTPV